MTRKAFPRGRAGWALTIGLIFAASMLAGCSGGDEDAGTSTAAATDSGSPRTKEEYVKRAEAICGKADDRVYDEAVAYRKDHAKELAKLEPVPREERIIRLIVLPSIKRQVSELQALGAPKGEEKKVKAIFAQIDSEVAQAEKEPYGLSLEIGYDYPFDRYARLARAYGLNECRNLA
jgi:hypothetical protein